MGLLDGKTAIVTGAARGIGKAIALKFAAEGANIAFTDLVIDENAENTAKELEAMGVKGALAVSGAQGITLLLPTETAQDETLRNRLIYAAASQTGVEEKDIQIILIKK